MSRGLRDIRRTRPARAGRGARGTFAAVGLAAVVLGAALGGCGDGSDRTAPASTPGPTPTTSVAELEQFAAVTIPAAATGVTVRSWTNEGGFQVYRAQFTVTEDGARAFCASGMDGALPLAAGLDERTRQRFDVPADETGRPLTCAAFSSSGPGVQRDALIIVAANGTATVRLLAYEVGR